MIMVSNKTSNTRLQSTSLIQSLTYKVGAQPSHSYELVLCAGSGFSTIAEGSSPLSNAVRPMSLSMVSLRVTSAWDRPAVPKISSISSSVLPLVSGTQKNTQIEPTVVTAPKNIWQLVSIISRFGNASHRAFVVLAWTEGNLQMHHIGWMK